MVRQLKDRVVGLIDRYKSQVDFLAIAVRAIAWYGYFFADWQGGNP